MQRQEIDPPELFKHPSFKRVVTVQGDIAEIWWWPPTQYTNWSHPSLESRVPDRDRSDGCSGSCERIICHRWL